MKLEADRAQNHLSMRYAADVADLTPEQTRLLIDETIDNYLAVSAPEDARPVVTGFVRDVVRASAPESVATATNRLTAASGLAAWCLSQGHPLDAQIVFAQPTREHYVTVVLSGRKANYRRAVGSSLSSIGRAVAPKRQLPRPIPRSRQQTALPYTPSVIAGYLRAAEAQRKALTRRRLFALLGTTAGGGYSGAETRLARGEDFEHVGDDLVARVRGPHERLTLIDPPFDAFMAEVAAEVGSDFLLPGKGRRQGVVSYTVALMPTTSLPALEPGRLQSTWRYVHEEQIGLDAFLAAAGVRDSKSIFDIAAMRGVPDLDRIRSIVRLRDAE